MSARLRTFLEPSLELPILFTQFLYFLLRLGLFIAPRLLEHLDFVLSHFQLPLEQVHLRFFLLDVLKFVFQVVHVYLHLMFQLYTHSSKEIVSYFDVSTNVRLKLLDHTLVYVRVVGFEFACASVHRLDSFFHRLHDQVVRADRNLPE